MAKSAGGKRASVKTLKPKINSKPTSKGRTPPGRVRHGAYESGSNYGKTR